MKKLLLTACCIPFLTSCVTRKLYNELDAKYKNCAEELERLSGEADLLKGQNAELNNQSQSLEAQLETAIDERDKLKVTLAQLQKEYDNLEKNSDKALKAEIARLNSVQQELEGKSSRVAELESKLDAQSKNLRQLKESLSKALFQFEGKGLTVEQKNGKVYVSMENKLLFPSGSWTVSAEGRTAVEQLAGVLAQNPEIAILIEGHTDNDKVIGNLGGGVTNNWDLSTKRATAIVNIIEQTAGIDKKNLTAAGRSEYAPIESNSTSAGKAKNRRIEVILTPKLDEISKLLNDL